MDIVVGSGSTIRTAKDANIFAEELTERQIFAAGKGKSWISAVAGAIDAIGGSEPNPIPEEKKGGTLPWKPNLYRVHIQSGGKIQLIASRTRLMCLAMILYAIAETPPSSKPYPRHPRNYRRQSNKLSTWHSTTSWPFLKVSIALNQDRLTSWNTLCTSL